MTCPGFEPGRADIYILQPQPLSQKTGTTIWIYGTRPRDFNLGPRMGPGTTQSDKRAIWAEPGIKRLMIVPVINFWIPSDAVYTWSPGSSQGQLN